MNKAIYIGVIVLLTCGCGTKNKSFNEQGDFSLPFVINNLHVSEKTYNCDSMECALNKLVYIGKVSDTIYLGRYDPYSYYFDFQNHDDSTISNQGLKLLIDKKQLLTLDSENYVIPPPPVFQEDKDYFEIDSAATAKIKEEWGKRPRNYIQAIPVFIYNSSRDTASIELQDGIIFMLQEAKDENGVWKPIEYWRYSTCGNSYKAQGLLPGDLVIAKVFKYGGKFETDMRIKMRSGDETFYSAPFKGSINKSQFERPSGIRDNYLGRKLGGKEYFRAIFLDE